MEAVARGVRRRGGTAWASCRASTAAPRRPTSACRSLTGMGHARNLAVVASGDVVIALGGSWGTLSEIGLARSIGREVVLLESWTVTPAEGEPDGLHRAADPPRPSSWPSPSRAVRACGRSGGRPVRAVRAASQARRRGAERQGLALAVGVGVAVAEPDGEGDGEALGVGAVLVPTSSTSGTIE